MACSAKFHLNRSRRLGVVTCSDFFQTLLKLYGPIAVQINIAVMNLFAFLVVSTDTSDSSFYYKEHIEN
jgi:hypothetical protein